MKKILAFVSALCMMGVAIQGQEVTVSAVGEKETVETTEKMPEYVYENFKYTKSEDYVSITGYVEEPTGELVIPAEIDGLPVKFIEQGAFEKCENITSLTIPDTMTTVSEYAFFCIARSGNTSFLLASIRMFNDENSIKTSAFFNCVGLKKIYVSDTNPTFSSVDGVLFNKNKTELIRYPAEKKESSYSIPETVTKISRFAFSGCTELKSVTIPNSVTNIEEKTFYYCSALTSVTLPDSVTSIAGNSFNFCKNLISVKIENPECEIYDDRYTISETAVIYGYEGSTAQAYAEKYNRKFEVIGSEPETEKLKQGDADSNGEIDILDVITVNKAILGKENLSETGLKAVDFNGNGKPDSDEALKILKFIVGLITDFNA